MPPPHAGGPVHDQRAREHQPAASQLGPRFHDWQLAQSPEESWRECHLHARNLLGKSGYFDLLSDVLRDAAPGGWQDALVFAYELSSKEDLLEVMTNALGKMDPVRWQQRMGDVHKVLSERGFSFDRADMSEALGKALRQVTAESREAARSAPKDLLGESAYRQLLAVLEKRGRKVAEEEASYDAYPGKMTQRRLFD